MADSIVTLYRDKETQTDRVFPSTKVEAISDAENRTLSYLLEQRISKDDANGVNEALSNGYLILTENQHYGSTLPTPGHVGRVFFRVAGAIPSAEEASF